VLTALLGRGQLAGPALFTLATEYTIVEVTGHAPAASVIAYAAGLIVVSELLLWAAQLPRSATADRAVATGRLTLLTAIAAAAALLALAVLAATDLRLPGRWRPRCSARPPRLPCSPCPGCCCAGPAVPRPASNPPARPEAKPQHLTPVARPHNAPTARTCPDWPTPAPPIAASSRLLAAGSRPAVPGPGECLLAGQQAERVAVGAGLVVGDQPAVPRFSLERIRPHVFRGAPECTGERENHCLAAPGGGAGVEHQGDMAEAQRGRAGVGWRLRRQTGDLAWPATFCSEILAFSVARNFVSAAWKERMPLAASRSWSPGG